MATLVIRINLDGAAFEGGNESHESARILRTYCQKWLEGTDSIPHSDRSVPLMDVNGNTVGHAKIEE